MSNKPADSSKQFISIDALLRVVIAERALGLLEEIP